MSSYLVWFCLAGQSLSLSLSRNLKLASASHLPLATRRSHDRSPAEAGRKWGPKLRALASRRFRASAWVLQPCNYLWHFWRRPLELATNTARLSGSPNAALAKREECNPVLCIYWIRGACTSSRGHAQRGTSANMAKLCNTWGLSLGAPILPCSSPPIPFPLNLLSSAPVVWVSAVAAAAAAVYN